MRALPPTSFPSVVLICAALASGGCAASSTLDPDAGREGPPDARPPDGAPPEPDGGGARVFPVAYLTVTERSNPACSFESTSCVASLLPEWDEDPPCDIENTFNTLSLSCPQAECEANLRFGSPLFHETGLVRLAGGGVCEYTACEGLRFPNGSFRPLFERAVLEDMLGCALPIPR